MPLSLSLSLSVDYLLLTKALNAGLWAAISYKQQPGKKQIICQYLISKYIEESLPFEEE